MAEVELKKITKFYGDVQAVKEVNLTVRDQEFLVLVGPSGCGKSTTLRMIAGLEDITDGDLFIAGRKVNDVAPKDRDIAMVFQSYALYPHMTVFENMAFGLRLRRMHKKEVKTRVEDAAKILGLEDLLQRKPKALSGGQRQRVAMGRAIVRRPAVFLFDEPLSNLDAKLRVQMRTEIARLHQQLGSTSIYVTHDQVEAMTLADRIVVMKDGVVQQVGAPMELYHSPQNLFVATFIGSPAMNLLEGEVQEIDDTLRLQGKGFSIPLSERLSSALKENGRGDNKAFVLGVRPQHIHLTDEKHQVEPIPLEVREPLGAETFLYFSLGEQSLVVREDGAEKRSLGEKYGMGFAPEGLHLFDKETGTALS